MAKELDIKKELASQSAHLHDLRQHMIENMQEVMEGMMIVEHELGKLQVHLAGLDGK